MSTVNFAKERYKVCYRVHRLWVDLTENGSNRSSAWREYITKAVRDLDEVQCGMLEILHRNKVSPCPVSECFVARDMISAPPETDISRIVERYGSGMRKALIAQVVLKGDLSD